MGVIDEIVAVRRHQVIVEGWSTDRDDRYVDHELMRGAIVHAFAALPDQDFVDDDPLINLVLDLWPWDLNCLGVSDVRASLIKAAAFIVAEIERLDRVGAVSSESDICDVNRRARARQNKRNAGCLP